MEFDLLTLFPRILEGPLEESILKRARERGLVKIRIHSLRDFTHDKHRVVDDKPYARGGPTGTPPIGREAPMAAVRRKSRAKERAPELTPADAARRLGIEQLRPEQERVIADVTAGRDVLMILPTGFGKSACYQIPSLLLPNPVLVISPLLALLRDQHTG